MTGATVWFIALRDNSWEAHVIEMKITSWDVLIDGAGSCLGVLDRSHRGRAVRLLLGDDVFEERPLSTSDGGGGR
jgi:hypothetical protein